MLGALDEMARRRWAILMSRERNRLTGSEIRYFGSLTVVILLLYPGQYAQPRASAKFTPASMSVVLPIVYDIKRIASRGQP